MLLGCEGGIKWFSSRKKTCLHCINSICILNSENSISSSHLGLAEVFGFAVFSEVYIGSALSISMVGVEEATPPSTKARCLCCFWHSQLLKIRVFASFTDKGLVVFPLTCSYGCLVFPFHPQLWDLILFHVLCYICEIALFPIFLFPHALENLCP